MKNLTISEIARMAGVSPTAVSFVLNNKEGVSEETRKKITEVIKKTNYKPSVNSRRLFFRKSFNLSIVIKQTSSPFENLFYFEISKGLLEKSKEYGYNIVFTDISIQGTDIILPRVIEMSDTDGVIFLQDTDMAILNEMDRRNLPYVVIDAHSISESITSVSVDYVLAAYTGTRYLIDHGHRDIAFIGSSYIPAYYMHAFNGFKSALNEIQAAPPISWLQSDAKDEESSYHCMERIFESGQIPSAVFCAGDLFAIGAMKCCREKGYRVPQDISFVGIDDIVLSRYFEPKLTTIHIDMAEMGRFAMELIVKKINGEHVESITVISDHLIERDSVFALSSK